MQQREEDIDIGIKILDVDDADEIGKAEEQAVADCDWHKVTGRSEAGDIVDVIVFRMEKDRRLKYRMTPLPEMTARNMERALDTEIGREYLPVLCQECGIEIEPDQEAIWSGDKHFCLTCGRKIYSEPVEEEGLMCTRCGCDIAIDDDIWGFSDDSDYADDICMCSRCAYIAHKIPVWEKWLKET